MSWNYLDKKDAIFVIAPLEASNQSRNFLILISSDLWKREKNSMRDKTARDRRFTTKKKFKKQSDENNFVIVLNLEIIFQ